MVWGKLIWQFFSLKNSTRLLDPTVHNWKLCTLNKCTEVILYKVFHLIWTLSPSVDRSCYRRRTQWEWWVPVRDRERRSISEKYIQAMLSSQANNSPRSGLTAGTGRNWTRAQSSFGTCLGNIGCFFKKKKKGSKLMYSRGTVAPPGVDYTQCPHP